MSATEHEVAEFANRGKNLVSKLTGAAAGSIIGTTLAGPIGAVVGSVAGVFLEFQMTRALGEFASRRLSERQAMRASAGITLLGGSLKLKIENGAQLRSDGFIESEQFEHNFSNEFIEHAIEAMMASIEERKIIFVSNFFVNVMLKSDIDRESFPSQVQTLSELSYRDLCIMKVISEKKDGQYSARPDDGNQGDFSFLAETLCRDVYRLIQLGLIVSQSDQASHLNAVLGYDDIEPMELRPNRSGQLFYDYLELSSLNDEDDVYKNCMQLLLEISNHPQNSNALNGGTY